MAPKQWFRSGSTPQQFYQELGNCQVMARSAVPDAPVTRSQTDFSKYTDPRAFSAAVYGNMGNQIGSMAQQTLVNNTRNQMVTQCMYQQGWVLE
jgi:hypothetical protein